MENSTIVLLCALACTIAVAFAHWNPTRDAREPPVVRPSIPIIGHAIGFVRHGQPYFVRLSAAHPDLPIFTVDLLVTKFYVISSPSLIGAVQRNSRALSFEYFINLSANRVLGIQGPGMNLLREEPKGGSGVGMKITHAMNPALLGPGLDRMNEKMVTFLKASVDQLSTAQNSDYDLFSWCRHAITVAATDSAYGKMNPYRSRELENAFWTMETNLDKFLVNIAPKITARTVWNARETLIEAFIKYYNANGLSDASDMANARWREQRSAGATLQDTARLEAGMALGLLSNTVPAAFWTLFEICSRPALLAEIRAEISRHALHNEDGVHTLDLADIRDRCELLVSTFQETLRVRSKAMPMRMTYQDVLLNEKYLLKEGGIVQMPSPVFHRNAVIWGDGADEFEPRRFMKGGNVKETRRIAGFLAFGISPSLCPGRHFATGEVLSLAAMLLLRYDIIPQRGDWAMPKVDAKSAAASFYTPAEEFRANFKARSEYEGTTWAYRVTAGKGRFGLIIG